MIKKIIVVVMAVVACIALGIYIKSYNSNNSFSAQQRFDTIMQGADEQAQDLLKETDEKKKKGIQLFIEKKDNLLQQQQKELFNQQ
ncbi:hypothetical protein [Commensalibacter nepenthis]|uniref:Uncharacterized protein n=1 Tax=Commensalibacter nepenthis TaxID=3043872 RepID=A0ABT6Q4U2_9PROT|nr:hypothetical protein [Commensalibacter sp. TBRC 10068]MDI2111913.1 hypothetical protein [Commensalibacter sp. TBRC 10068]